MKTDITLSEAQAMLADLIKPRTTSETRALAKCPGSILADDITAPLDVPNTDTAAVDGFAFNHQAAQAAEFRLKISGEARAGHPLPTPFVAGTAVAITTGAAMPHAVHKKDSPDTIAMTEDCQFDAGWVTLPANITVGSNFRPAGENIKQGDTALRRGSHLGAAEVGLAAALGLAELPIAKPLTIAILSTGDELAKGVSKISTGQIYDANRPMLAALLAEAGHKVIDGGIAQDTLAAVTAKYKSLLRQADALITTGGSASGGEDYAKQAMAELGGAVDFWRLRIKPGRPFAFGRIDGKPVFCLPGNPVAVVVTYRLLVAAALLRLMGGTPQPALRIPVVAGFAMKHRQGRDDFVRVTITWDDPTYPAQAVAHRHGRLGAGVLTSLAGADGLLHIPADKEALQPGDRVPFLPLRKI